MNCTEVASVLDESPVELSSNGLPRAIAAHVEDCRDCAAAVIAQRGMAADAPGFASDDLLDRILGALPGDSSATQRAAKRRPRRLAIVGGILVLGGAVYAAIRVLSGDADLPFGESMVSQGREATESEDDYSTDESSEQNVAESLMAFVDAAEAEDQRAFTDTWLGSGSLPDGEYFSLLKVAPRYPDEAAAAGLEGAAVVEFTVTETGDVADVTIAESTHALFEQPSIDAARRFKYKPRVANGSAEPVPGVRNRIAFVLHNAQLADENEPESAGTGGTEDSDSVDEQSQQAFDALLMPILECLQAGNLQCIELGLDEMLAIREWTPIQVAQVSRIYGFVHHRQGNYERAIEAYERAVGLIGDVSQHYYTAPLMTIARIHYERGRYQQAFDAAVEYLKHASNVSAGAYGFVDELRRLGAVPR